jgi:hypothetical protein
MNREVLTFDWGSNLIGIYAPADGEYKPYYGEESAEGAERLMRAGKIISFAGKFRDVPEIEILYRRFSGNVFKVSCEHVDMQEVFSELHYPARPGGRSIVGGISLDEAYEKVFGQCPKLKNPEQYPVHQREHIESNWRDCYRTWLLYEAWHAGNIRPWK